METDNVKSVLEESAAKAEELLKDPSSIDSILKKLEEKLKEVPAIGTMLSDIPLMVAMIKSYITGKYTVVSVKVIALLVGSILYLLTKKDLIADNKPLVGYADDIAVIAFALKLCEPELSAFAAWRDGNTAEIETEPLEQEL